VIQEAGINAARGSTAPGERRWVLGEELNQAPSSQPEERILAEASSIGQDTTQIKTSSIGQDTTQIKTSSIGQDTTQIKASSIEQEPPCAGNHPRALSPSERKQVLDVLHQPRFVDQSPAEIFATLLDEERYLCSERTMYRILGDNAEVRERRDQLRHPSYNAPQLLATKPNELWSWDITKLLGPAKWTYFYLYVILDVFSRYVVGWMVADQELATLAHDLINETCRRRGSSLSNSPCTPTGGPL
jgi:Integrase core domain